MILTPVVLVGGGAVTVCISEVVKEVRELSGIIVVWLAGLAGVSTIGEVASIVGVSGALLIAAGEVDSGVGVADTKIVVVDVLVDGPRSTRVTGTLVLLLPFLGEDVRPREDGDFDERRVAVLRLTDVVLKLVTYIFSVSVG